jgi:hypothetical protein
MKTAVRQWKNLSCRMMKIRLLTHLSEQARTLCLLAWLPASP